MIVAYRSRNAFRSRSALTKPITPAGHFGTPNLLTETAKNFLTAVIASSDDAIISKDLNGIISSWNEGARRIFGYEADEIIGQSILRLIPPELHPDEDIILAKIRAGERIDHFETIRVRKNEERFPVSVTISPIKDDAGVPALRRMDRGLRLRTAHRRSARPHHPSRPHPGNERR
jgi:PAS domain S-box-containing protein